MWAPLLPEVAMTRHHATYLQSFISCLYFISPESTLACVFDMQQISPPPSWRSSFTTTMLEQCDDACLSLFPVILLDSARFQSPTRRKTPTSRTSRRCHRWYWRRRLANRATVVGTVFVKCGGRSSENESITVASSSLT